MRIYLLVALLGISFSFPAMCILADPGAPYFRGDNGMGPMIAVPAIPVVVESAVIKPAPPVLVPSTPLSFDVPGESDTPGHGAPMVHALLLLELPEPGTWLMLATGGALLLASRRR